MVEDMDTALLRDKRIKNWNRQWKINMIEALNPDWKNLFEDTKISMARVVDY